MLNEINECVKVFDANNNIKVVNLKTLKGRFEQKFDAIKLLNEEILTLIEDEDDVLYLYQQTKCLKKRKCHR